MTEVLPDSEWLRLMLDELARRRAEETQAAEERGRRTGDDPVENDDQAPAAQAPLPGTSGETPGN